MELQLLITFRQETRLQRVLRIITRHADGINCGKTAPSTEKKLLQQDTVPSHTSVVAMAKIHE